MSSSRYRVTVNGFWCHNETWDDAFNWDGKHDEVFVDVNVKVLDASGQVLQNYDSESELMGDTWRLPNRIQAGSASSAGGIVSGDKFPTDRPWARTGPANQLRYPPYVIWEGELRDEQDMVMLTPTIWEWDPGAGFWDGWLAWQVQVDADYGRRAKEIFGKIWPVSAPVFDAVSLGIQTVGTLAGLWSPLGQSMRRPIGLSRDPANPDGFLFNPRTIALNTETADYLSSANLLGYGQGIVELRYVDDPYLRGVYSLFVQVEKLASTTPAPSGWTDVGHANGVTSMTALDGYLYAVTADQSLWRREAVKHEVDWTRIGHAYDVVGLSGAGGRLFCATTANRLWTRQATPVDMNWSDIGHANGVVGLAAANGSLFCATDDNGLWMRSPVLSDVAWARIGHANDVTSLAGTGAQLYCRTFDGRLWRRDAVATDIPWQPIGSAPEAVAIAATSTDLFAASNGNRLLYRPV